MRVAVLVVAIAACGEARPPRPRLPELVPTVAVEDRHNGRWPSLEPDGRIEAMPIDPYAPEPPPPALRDRVDDHVPSNVELYDPGEVTAMTVRLDVGNYRLPSSANHRVVEDHDQQVITIHTGPGSPVTAAERAEALRATTAADATTPSIKSAAREATKGARTDHQRVNQLVDWVYTHTTYVLANEKVASVVLARGSGDCSEMSLLFVALARASGVPARRVVGLAATRVENAPAFGFHAWAEVALDGHWVQVDPTWNETVADATHIILLEGDGDRWNRAADALKLAVVDVKRDQTLRGRANARWLTSELPEYMRLRPHM